MEFLGDVNDICRDLGVYSAFLRADSSTGCRFLGGRGGGGGAKRASYQHCGKS